MRLETFTDGWKPDNAQKNMEQCLTSTNNMVDAVLSENDGMASGVVAALEAQGRAARVLAPVSEPGLLQGRGDPRVAQQEVGRVHQHPAAGEQRPDRSGMDAGPGGKKAVEARPAGAHGLLQDVQGDGLGDLDPVDARRQYAPRITRALPGGIESPGVDTLAVATAPDTDG